MKIIRDPVCGYIYLDDLELSIVDSLYFQRLRNIRQNATAYLTYPSANQSRFEHSLGTCEIAGRMINSVIQYSDNQDLNNFLELCATEFGIDAEDKEGIKERIVRIVRLAALLHDIGHLPFSHVSEKALKMADILGTIYSDSEENAKYVMYDMHPHEFASIRICETNLDLFKGDGALQMQVINVMRGGNQVNHVFETLHQIISSQIDADRSDYLLRDGSLSGAGFGQYDIDRLLFSMRLKQLPDGKFIIAPLVGAISAVETFLTERFKIHKYLYYHQKVVFTDLMLSLVIQNMLEFSKRCIENELVEEAQVEDLGSPFLSLQRFSYANYVKDNIFFDDYYLMPKIRSYYLLLQRFSSELEEGAHQKKSLAACRMIEALLYRANVGDALWKYTNEYQEFGTAVLKQKFNNAAMEKRRVESGAGDFVDYGSNIPILNYIESKFLRATGPINTLTRLLQQCSEDYFFVIATKLFAPYRYSRSSAEMSLANAFLVPDSTAIEIKPLKLLGKDGSTLDLFNYSRVVKSMYDAWEQDIHVYVYMMKYDGHAHEGDPRELWEHFSDVLVQWFMGLNS